MKNIHLTNSEILVLGLLAEMPRHGYELEKIIQQRDMREWTQIGFSSIYYVLGKLEAKGLVSANRPKSTKAKKSYAITGAGQDLLVDQTQHALTTISANHSSVLMGLLHWPVLTRTQALKALKQRQLAVTQESERLKAIHFKQQPLPDHINSLFEFSIGQLHSESEWLAELSEYMQTKPWNT